MLHALVEEAVNRTIESLAIDAEKDRVERNKKDEKRRELVRQKRLEQAKVAGVKGPGT